MYLDVKGNNTWWCTRDRLSWLLCWFRFTMVNDCWGPKYLCATHLLLIAVLLFSCKDAEKKESLITCNSPKF